MSREDRFKERINILRSRFLDYKERSPYSIFKEHLLQVFENQTYKRSPSIRYRSSYRTIGIAFKKSSLETKQHCLKLAQLHSKSVQKKMLGYSTELSKPRQTFKRKMVIDDSHSEKETF